MADHSEELAPPKEQSLFPLRAEDILDNAFQNLDPQQAKEVSRKAASEVLKIEVERRLAEQRGEAAHQEINNIIASANLLDQTAGDYKINSTFQTASGTTNVEINKAKLNTKLLLVIVAGLLVFLLLIIAIFLRS
jgi:hypothetical protein